MSASVQPPTVEPRPEMSTRSEPPRLRTVTGNPFPRKCACGCGGSIPRDSQLRYVVDFSGPKPFKTYLREHSPDFGSAFNRGSNRIRAVASGQSELPGFRPAIELLNEPGAATESTVTSDRVAAHDEPEPGPSPEAGRPWASGQLVFNAGQFQSPRSGFADYARLGETAAQLRARVNRVNLEDLEQKVLALRALHEKLRPRLGGPTFGDVVARGRPEQPPPARSWELSMFEFRARILQAGPNSFLGLVDGYPQVFTESPTSGRAEIDVTNALSDFLSSLGQPYGGRVEQDDFPIVCRFDLRVARRLA